ncbi:MAG: hypothetical protein GH151_15245 [Bacteroidetes bacterium]|nr:hypothetical protein [Bacteroidota bacterium]
MSSFERTIGLNEVRANLHELVPRPGLWERITIVGVNNPVGVSVDNNRPANVRPVKSGKAGMPWHYFTGQAVPGRVSKNSSGSGRRQE